MSTYIEGNFNHLKLSLDKFNKRLILNEAILQNKPAALNLNLFNNYHILLIKWDLHFQFFKLFSTFRYR